MKTQPESEISNFRVQAFLLLGSFWKKLRSSTWEQVLWCWTVIGRGWNFSTRGPGGMDVRQTGLNWSLQTTTLWWRCPRHSCLSPKWESKTAALVLAWKYIAVFQDANHVFSMSVVCMLGYLGSMLFRLLSYNWTAIRGASYRNLWPKHWLYFTGFNPLLRMPCCKVRKVRHVINSVKWRASCRSRISIISILFKSFQVSKLFRK